MEGKDMCNSLLLVVIKYHVCLPVFVALDFPRPFSSRQELVFCLASPTTLGLATLLEICLMLLAGGCWLFG
eukprot:2750794-Prorocentrum_lima.AAC.1